jgi:hypothetical protein
VKVKLSTGEDEILLTNLFDQEVYTLDDLKELYALRWGGKNGQIDHPIPM